VHTPQAPESSLHWKLEPPSFELNPKLGAFELLSAAGWLVSEATGGVVSTVHVKESALPVLPAGSVALTRNVWLPSVRPG
jgi:hypothetical protein